MSKLHFDYKSLDELGLISRGRSKHRPRDAAHLYGGKYPFIQTGDIKHAGLYLTQYSQTYSEAGLAQSKLWPAGTLCITIAANIAETAILGIDACFPDSVIGFIANDKLADVHYIKYLFDSQLKRQYQQYSQGVAQDNLSQEKLLSIKLPIPPLPIQRKIAAVLTALDDKIALNKRINDKLEAMAKRLYDYWFVQFDFPDENGRPYKSSGGKMVWNETLKREIPVGWEVKSIDDYCRIFTGKKDVNQSLGEGKYKFFSCAPDHRYSNEMLFDGKAIIISGNGSYTGRTIFVNCAFDLYQRTYAVVQNIDSDNNLEYIYCSVKKFLHTKVSGGTHGSAIPYIVYNDIAKEMLVYSSYVVARFQKIIIPIMGKIVNFETEITHLTTLRDRLLPLLMNGQVEAGGSIS